MKTAKEIFNKKAQFKNDFDLISAIANGQKVTGNSFYYGQYIVMDKDTGNLVGRDGKPMELYAIEENDGMIIYSNEFFPLIRKPTDTNPIPLSLGQKGRICYVWDDYLLRVDDFSECEIAIVEGIVEVDSNGEGGGITSFLTTNGKEYDYAYPLTKEELAELSHE